jgi:hypothetical protein
MRLRWARQVVFARGARRADVADVVVAVRIASWQARH